MIRTLLFSRSWQIILYLVLCMGFSVDGDTSQQQTVFPQYLGQTPYSNHPPWGDAVYGGQIPNTGVVRRYTFTVTRRDASPDGFNRSLLLVNNAFPGPLVEANWGDTIEVTVLNLVNHPAEGISIHWHGQPQRLTPWMDGVPAVTQCPIAPGASFTYRFQAEVYGTSWWHSHISGQYMDGLFGPMIIYGPSQQAYDQDLGPVMLHDYLHELHETYISASFGIPPTFLALDNNLINGRNPFNCSLSRQSGATCDSRSSTFSRFRFTKGKTHRLRLINSGTTDNQKFSIDNHTMTVIAQDYVPLKPYNTTVVTLGPGQRSDVLVYGSGSSNGLYWMRSDLDTTAICGNSSTVISKAKAIVMYDNASSSKLPSTTATQWDSNNCKNDPLSSQVPYYPISPPSTPGETQTLDIRLFVNETGHLLFSLNGVSFRGDYNLPLLYLASQGNTSFPQEQNTYNFGKNTSIRTVWYNYFPGPHPMHLHGHDFWILQEGYGTWDGTIVNPQNPARRDTHTLAPGIFDGSPLASTTPSYVVLEWMSDNPGIWPFHCHIVGHSSFGLLLNSLEQPDAIRNYSQIAKITEQTCKPWNAWTKSNNVDQIDSGV